jgi:uncharacterized HAD superfamily protein
MRRVMTQVEIVLSIFVVVLGLLNLLGYIVHDIRLIRLEAFEKAYTRALEVHFKRSELDHDRINQLSNEIKELHQMMYTEAYKQWLQQRNLAQNYGKLEGPR